MPIEIKDKIGSRTFKQHLEYIRGRLRDDRSSFDAHWKEISKFTAPRRARFEVNDRNKGQRQWHNIINNIATYAVRIAVAGMFAGNVSPARPWFALVHPDDDLMEKDEVKLWLHRVEQKILSVFRDSNFYNVIPKVLKDLLLFGTSAMSQVDDFEDVARFYSYPIGSYYLGLDSTLKANQLIRELILTVDQTVERFGIDNVSNQVRNSYQNGNYKQEVVIVHHVGPNHLLQPGNPFALGKPFIGVYYELGLGSSASHNSLTTVSSGSGGKLGDDFLGVEGFFEQPFYAPRWSVEGEDTYATECPGMIVLGDVKQLQTQEKRKGQAIDKQTNPPLQAPATLQNQGVNALPGGVSYVQMGTEQGKGISSLYEVNLNIQDLRVDMKEVENRIKDGFFVSLFLAITEAEGIQPRNEYELITRNDEKLLQLGPVLQQVQGELLSPIVDRTFNQLVRADADGRNGVLPPVPEVLREQALEIRYISSLAQAQRAVATQAIDRTFAFAARAAEIKPETVDKIDTDWMVEEYARVTGVPPKGIVGDDKVEQIRQQRAQAEQQQREAELAVQGAKGMKDVAGAAQVAGKSA